MSLHCEHCAATFQTNAKLYMHKKRAHGTPSLLLLNHNHSSDPNPGTKRKATGNNPSTPKPKRSNDDPQLDDGLSVIDEENDNDEENAKLDPQLDDGLKIIDEVRDEEDDAQDDNNLTVIDEWNRKKDYKKLYNECLKDGAARKTKHRREKEQLISQYKNVLSKRLHEQRVNYESKVADLKIRHDKQMLDLEEMKDGLCKDEIDKIQTESAKAKEEYELEIKNLKAAIKKYADDASESTKRHKAEMDNIEEQCREKIRTLEELVKSLQEDDLDINPLVNAIFNCTTMEEIIKIQRLVESHQIDVVIRDHLKTLQDLFLSLSYGILPICQPQRKRVTDNQRDLVEKIQTATKPTAKRLLTANKDQVVNLFSIIKDSIKLARNSYNKYSSP